MPEHTHLTVWRKFNAPMSKIKTVLHAAMNTNPVHVPINGRDTDWYVSSRDTGRGLMEGILIGTLVAGILDEDYCENINHRHDGGRVLRISKSGTGTPQPLYDSHYYQH